MNASQAAETSFVLLQAEWPLERALRLIRAIRPSHVIVHRTGPRDVFYLFTVGEALDRFNQRPGAAIVHEAADLDEAVPAEVVEASAPPEAMPERGVVIDDGRIVGLAGGLPVHLGVQSPAPVRTTRGFDISRQRGGIEGDLSRDRGGAASAGAPDTVDRSLVAEFPDRVAVDREAWLLVSLSATAGPGTGIAVSLPAGETIDVLVQAKRGFQVLGQDHDTLTVTGEEESLPLRFKLKATEVGPGSIVVLAFRGAQALGRITVTPMVEAAASPGATEAVEASRTHQEALAPIAVRVPDLSILIEERESGGTPEYMIRLTASNPALGLNLKQYGPLQIRMNPVKFFGDFFEDIEALRVTTPADRAVAERKLAARGANLFQQLFPKDLQQQMWALKDSIQSVLIQSEEPWIPWELCKLVGEEDGRTVEGPFLCEAYTVTRWVPGLGFRQPLSLDAIALVVPRDSNLPSAQIEQDYMMSLAGDRRQVELVPANFIDVQTAMASGRFDCWHFTGHGGAVDENPDRSAMYLEKNDPFTPEDLSGAATNLRQGRPLVFLNACQIGRGGMSLTGIGGWARRFVDAGAGAFVGAYWSVYDEPAALFAKSLYDRLIGGAAIGQAVRDARQDIRPAGDATWLAYTVFADPLAGLGSSAVRR